MGIEFTETHITKLMEVDNRSRTNAEKISELSDDVKKIQEDNKVLYEMTASIQALASNVGDIKEDVKEIRVDQAGLKAEVQEIKNEPIKKKAGFVDGTTKLILTALGTGIVAFILGQICPAIFGG